VPEAVFPYELTCQFLLVGQAGGLPNTTVDPHTVRITPAVRSDSDLRTGSGNLHPEGAFRDGRSGPSTRQIIPDQKALSPTPPNHPDSRYCTAEASQSHGIRWYC
jgi:hypothetical protein